MINIIDNQLVRIMKLFAMLALFLLSYATNAQLVGRKKHKLYLYQYDQKRRDGIILFEIDTRMVDIIESISISNRKRFGKRSYTVRVGEEHYQYESRGGFTVLAELCRMREVMGRFSDTATVDIRIRLLGEDRKYTWEKSVLLDKRRLKKVQYVRFR